MNKIAKNLTSYAIYKGTIKETDRNVYEYGFTITIELSLFVLACLLIMLHLHMFVEGILFFIIFSPLRSYAGGLHLERYHSCLILSCLTFYGILSLVKYFCFPVSFSFIAICFLEIVVYALYPVENANRKVNEEENRYFRKKLKGFLFWDMLISAVCVALKKNSYVFLITVTFLMVAVTMMFGKYKNWKRKIS